MDEDWQRANADALAGLAATVRADLWQKVGLSGPLTPAAVMPWLLERASEQKRSGDRLRLYLPADAARKERQKELEQLTAQAQAQGETAVPTNKRLIRSNGSRFYLDVFAGFYLEEDLGDLATRTWPSPFRISLLPDLALIALAAREVHRVTGCNLEDGLLFLLCDLPCGEAFRISMSTDSGLRLWAYSTFVTADELRAQYMDFRRQFMPRTRAKRPERHTLELIQLVQEMRPQGGRQGASWNEVLKRWNAERDAKHAGTKKYADWASISKAYTQALKRRRELGLLPRETA